MKFIYLHGQQNLSSYSSQGCLFSLEGTHVSFFIERFTFWSVSLYNKPLLDRALTPVGFEHTFPWLFCLIRSRVSISIFAFGVRSLKYEVHPLLNGQVPTKSKFNLVLKVDVFQLKQKKSKTLRKILKQVDLSIFIREPKKAVLEMNYNFNSFKSILKKIFLNVMSSNSSF